MGCAGGKPAGGVAGRASEDAGGKALPKGTPSKKDLLKKGSGRMSIASTEGAQKIFRRYRHSVPNLAEMSQGSARRGGRMTHDNLRQALPDVDDELFRFVWTLFDPEGKGEVYSDEFVAATALLTTSHEGTLDEQIEACFVMFDTRNDGKLSHAEFRSMLEATVTLNLKRMLESEEGTKAVSDHMVRPPRRATPPPPQTRGRRAPIARAPLPLTPARATASPLHPAHTGEGVLSGEPPLLAGGMRVQGHRGRCGAEGPRRRAHEAVRHARRRRGGQPAQQYQGARSHAFGSRRRHAIASALVR